MSVRRANTVVSIIVLLALLIQPLAAGAAATGLQSGTSTALTPAPPQPGQGFLFRASVTLAGSRNLARLEKVGVLVLDTFDSNDAQTALVLANGEQMESLARLGFRPQAADELRLLVNAQGPERRWLAKSLEPLLAQADAIVAQQAFVGVTGTAVAPDVAPLVASLRTAVSALTPEQIAAVGDSVSVDDDADGLTNTQESWWCTDPMDTDTDDDGRTDGAEIQALQDWIANERTSAPGETPWPSWPFNTTTCPDKDHDSIPNLAERWELGLNMDLESSDRDKFDDGQELFGVTYCPGGDLSCGYGDLPRSSDSGYVGAAMPSWVKAPGKHPLAAAFPVPEVDVHQDSLVVSAVTVVTTNRTVEENEQTTYSTAVMTGTSTSIADTTTWNSWEEFSTTTPVASGLASASGADSPRTAKKSGLMKFLGKATKQLGKAINIGNQVLDIAEMPIKAWNLGTQYGEGINQAIYTGYRMYDDVRSGRGLQWPKTYLDEYDDIEANANRCTGGCATGLGQAGAGEGLSYQDGEGQNYVTGRSGRYMAVDDSNVYAERYYPLSFAGPYQLPTETETSGSSWGGAQTTTNTEYQEQTVTSGNAFGTTEGWGTATAVDSSHAADLWFTYDIINSGTEYAREIGDLTFNIYIGDSPNPAYTYYVASDLGGDGKLHNFMPGEKHTYTAHHIPLSLDQMRAIDLGDPVRIVVEDFTYGVDELFYQDASNGGLQLAIDDGEEDDDENIDNFLVPTWGSETVLDVLARYFPHSTDADGNLVAIWTPETRSDTPAWCIEPNHVGGTLWCKHALSAADWWNIYTDGMGDGSEGFQDTPASPGQVALFRFNKDSDLDGYSDRSEERLGTDASDAASFPKPELIAGLYSIPSGNQVVSTLSLLNTGLYDAYGVEAVMIAPDDSISITNNTVGGSGRVRAQRQVIVGSRIVLQDPLPNAWIQTGHAQPAVGGYYTGPVDRTYSFSVTCSLPAGCDVSSGAWSLNWADGLGASGSLNFGAGYNSPALRAVGAFGLQIGLLSGKVYGGDAFSVDALTPRDTFRYTIAAGHESDFTPPVVIVSYNDPQGNHRFVTPINLTSPTDDLSVHAGKMLHAGADVEIVTSEAFDPDAPNTTSLILQVPATRMADAHAFLDFIDSDGNVVREEALTQTLETGPNIVPITWNPANFNPPYDPTKDYIVMAFFTDWQGNILDTAARPLSSFQEDPRPVFAFDLDATIWDFGTVPQGQKLEHTFTLANTGLMGLKAVVVGTGARADQSVPGTAAWTDTGLDLIAGDALGVRASGQVCYATNGTTSCYGPAGITEVAPADWTAPGAAKYSLVAKIGGNSPFMIGSTYTGIADASGRLYLGANDRIGTYGDNGGAYQAHIEIQGLPTSLEGIPGFTIAPADTANLDVSIDTYYLPVGAFDRTMTVRTSDPTRPTQTFRVQGTVQPYVAPAQARGISSYRPWDLYVAVAGNGAKRAVVTFDDPIAADAASVQPLRVYDTDRQTQLGSGREVARADASLGLPIASMASSTVTDSTLTPAAKAGLAIGAPNLDVSQFGTGRDGDLVVTEGQTVTINTTRFSLATDQMAGQSALNIAGIPVQAARATGKGEVTQSFSAGDEVMIIQMQGGEVGYFEFGYLSEVGSDYLVLTRPLSHNYLVEGHAATQIMKVLHYRNVYIAGKLTAPLWDGATGGILAFRATGITKITPTGDVDVNGQGYGGGPGGNESPASRPDTGSTGASYTNSSPLNGSIGDDCGGCISPEGPWNGGGGRGGRGQRGTDGASGGGGGSYGSSGTAGINAPVSPHAPGGVPGSTYGSSTLSTIYLGSGGGGGGKGKDGYGASGGNGGGIINISTGSLVVTGYLRANGLGGGSDKSGNAGGGGGGSGGSIFLNVSSADLGSGKVTAVGGGGSDGNSTGNGARGGDGGAGRIRVEYCSTVSGSTNPGYSGYQKSCYGTLQGRVFSDINGNGVQNTGEPGLANATVTVGSAGNATTNSNGDYTKTVNAPGSYTVSVTPPSGYHCITPCSVATSVNPDETKTVNFALQPRVSVAGKVFHDTNNNGVQNTGEAGIAGTTVQLSTGATRTTASDGSYSFADLQPGSYSATVTVLDGYVNTTNTSVTCNLTAGETCTANFGILQYTIEKVASSPHQNRLFLPEDFTSGRRYWVQYGRSLSFVAAGSLTAQIEAPQVHYGSAELDVFVTSPASSNIFLQIGLDVGCDSSQEWSINGNYAVPVTFAATGLAVGFNRYLATLPPDPDGSVTIPLCTSLNLAGQLYLTDLVLTPDGISDVSIAASDIALNPTNPVEGDEVTVQAVVHNASQFASGALTASFYATSPDWGEWYIGSAFVPNVPAGGTAQAEIPWNTLGFTGATPVRVSIDPYNRIAETNETNNQTTASLTIRTRPDLHVTAIALSDTEPVVGQVVTATLTLHNNGQTGAGPFTVDLYDGNPASGGTLVQTLDVAALAGGTSSNLLASWTPAAPGEHRLFIEVDPGRAVSEYAEDNNETWDDVYVGLAGPILIDSGGGDAYDPAYTTENGFGYLDGETSTFCGDEPDKTQRSDYDAEVQYRFDHLLPGHFYHLDVTLFECDGTGRQEKISVDDNVIEPLIDLADGAVHRLSYLLDPAFYADRSVLISIAEIYGNDVVVSEVNLYDVDYRYSDAGGGNDPAYSLATGYGWLDGVAQTSWGTLPYQSRRTDTPDSNPDDDPDNELRYRYDRLDPARRYQLHATVYQGAGTGTVIESIAVDDVDTGTTITVVGVQRRDVTLAIPPGTYASDRSIVVRIIRTNAAANAFVNLIALEELTLSQGSDEFQNLTLHGTSPNWISFNIKPPVRPALYCSGVTATSAFTILAGDALLASAAAPVNSLVEAYTPAGVKVGCHKVTTAGQYGYMRVYGAEGATPGMAPGEPVQLKINGIASQPAPYPVIWQNDKLTRDVDLAAAEVIPVETFLDPIAGQVVKLQSETGTYLPPPADPRFNTTTTVAAGWGYLLYTNAAATLAVMGDRVPADTPLALHAGWNWLGYLPTCELPVATALAGIAGRYDLLHNEVGTYRPPPANPAYNTFNTMAPGKGYMIHMTAAATLTYPATGCGAAAGTEPVAESIGAMPACPAVATGVFTHYYGAAVTGDRPAPAGAVILAYSPRGEVVGCGAVQEDGLYPYLRVYGAADAQPGMQPEEAVHFTVNGRLMQPSAAASWQNDWGVYPLDLEIGGSQTYLPLIVR